MLRMPKDLLHVELAQGIRLTGRPHFKYKDVCKRDLVVLDINLITWETIAKHRTSGGILTLRISPALKINSNHVLSLRGFKEKHRRKTNDLPHSIHMWQVWQV